MFFCVDVTILTFLLFRKLLQIYILVYIIFLLCIIYNLLTSFIFVSLTKILYNIIIMQITVKTFTINLPYYVMNYCK